MATLTLHVLPHRPSNGEAINPKEVAADLCQMFDLVLVQVEQARILLRTRQVGASLSRMTRNRLVDHTVDTVGDVVYVDGEHDNKVLKEVLR